MKFRIWSNKLKKFVDSSRWYLNPDGELFYEDMMEGGLIKAPIKSYMIQRSIGIRDSRGTLIYEGDILKYTHDESEVTVRWSYEHEDYHPGWVTTNLIGQGGPCIITGNIFEK